MNDVSRKLNRLSTLNVSSTPNFFLEFLKKENFPDFPDNPVMSRSSLDAVDIKKLKFVPLMFQIGNLTIEKEIESNIYLLKRPNIEVNNALNDNLLDYLLGRDVASISLLRERIRMPTKYVLPFR